ncbi:zinc-ribbon domain-containing protein [Leifsonia aquatica]|uniref:zinc-ribbon domain-containing protein n=1 Tax=Leifsonia aquatica TaxID=144185 RepID=UPI0037F8AB46
MTLDILTRRYPMPVRPRHRETLTSFGDRVLAANGETEQHKNHLIRLATRSKRSIDRQSAWLDLLRAKTGRPSLSFRSELHTFTIHEGNAVCGNCHDRVPLRRMCDRCAGGETITQVRHFDDIVCLNHRRWVGLERGAQATVDQRYVDAALRLGRLRRKRRVDARLYRFLVDALGRTGSHGTAAERERAVFVEVVALADALTRREFTAKLFLYRDGYEPAWDLLRETVRDAIGRDEPAVSRRLWFYLRPSFAALRWAWLTQTNYVPFFSHDFIVPATVADAYLQAKAEDSHEARVLQIRPFSEYLAVTGDTIDTVNESRTEDSRIINEQVSGMMTIPFLCAEGHHTVLQRSAGLTQTVRKLPNCTVCSGRVVVADVNDLATFHPRIAAQLDAVLSRVTAREVSRAAAVEVAWRCRVGHRYWATVNNRVNGHTGCRYCFGYVLPGVNDLSTTHPHIALELNDPRKDALHVTASAEDTLEWRCTVGHDYRMRVVERTRRTMCPTCEREKNIAGRNLTATHPEVARHWHPDRNGTRLPEHYTHGSGAEVWWACDRGPDHAHKMRIERKTAGIGCPACSSRRLIPGVTDLATREPIMAREYHPHLNGALEPNEVFPSDTKFHWLCLEAGHHTHQTVQHRRQSRGCIECEPEKRILVTRRAA